MSTQQPPAAKKPGGGLWGVFRKALSNVSFEVNVGTPSARGATRNPTDPQARMEPVRQDRKETYDEMVYRTTDGQDGQAPMVRVDRDRQQVARSLDARAPAAHDEPSIPKSGGAPLPKDVRERMEPRLGSDLSGVRVGTGGESQRAAAGLGAKAFTVGSDVHFGSGQFQPGTKEGDRLLAHELTHVVQGKQAGVQRKADSDGAGASGEEHKVSDPAEPAEKEADAVADHVTNDLHGGKEGAGAGGKAADATSQDGKHGGAEQKEGKNGEGDGHNAANRSKEGQSEPAKAASPDKPGPSNHDAGKQSGSTGAKTEGTAPASAGKVDAKAPASSGADAKAGAGGNPAAGAGTAAAPSSAGADVKQQAPRVGTKKKDDEALPIRAAFVGVGRKIHRTQAAGAAGPARQSARSTPLPTQAPAGGAAPGAAASGAAASARAAPVSPTQLILPAPPTVTDISAELEIEIKTAQSTVVGGGGNPLAVAEQVKAKGGHQDAAVLTLPPVAAGALGVAASVQGAAQAVMASTGVGTVQVKKTGPDELTLDPQVNPTAPGPKIRAEAEKKASTLSGWFKQADLSGVGVKNLGKMISYWRSPASKFLTGDDRGNFRITSQMASYAENPDDKKDLQAAAEEKFGQVRAQWSQQLTDPTQLVSDKPPAPPPLILSGFDSDATLTAGKTVATNNLLAKLPTFAGNTGSTYKAVTKGAVADTIKEGGAYRGDFLNQPGEGVASAAKTFALTRVDPAGELKAKVDAGVHYDPARGDYGTVRVPSQDDSAEHNYYFPRELRRNPPTGCHADGTYQIMYKGYKNAEFVVTVGANNQTSRIEGKALTLKVPGDPRGITNDSPHYPALPGAASAAAAGAGGGAAHAAAAGPGAATAGPASAAAAGPGAVSASAGSATAAPAAAAATPLNRSHLIGDLFRGSGYREALNLVTASRGYNQTLMGGIEDQMVLFLNANLPTRESEFNLAVEVDWAQGNDANAMIADVMAAAGAVAWTPARTAAVQQGLQRFMADNHNRQIVKGVKYHLTGMGKTGAAFNMPYLLGPDTMV